jgi:hypothetical protein
MTGDSMRSHVHGPMQPRGGACYGGSGWPARARHLRGYSGFGKRQQRITAITKAVAAPQAPNMPAAAGWSAARAIPARQAAGVSVPRAVNAVEAAPNEEPPAPDIAIGVTPVPVAAPATAGRAAPATSRQILVSPAPAARSIRVSTAWSAARTCPVWPVALVSASTAAESHM